VHILTPFQPSEPWAQPGSRAGVCVLGPDSRAVTTDKSLRLDSGSLGAQCSLDLL
jgi:hypothetical protein